MFRAWKPGLLGLKGTEIATCRSAEGRRCSQTVLGEREWWILMGRRNENSRFSRVFSRLELLICQSRYEYVNRIVAKRRNEGDFEVRSWKLYCDGIRVFLMRYLSFRVDIEWIESRESESLILVGNCEENSLRSWCARVHSVEIVVVVDDDSYDSLWGTIEIEYRYLNYC